MLKRVESSWNVMAHGDARVGEVKGKLANALGSSTLHTNLVHGVSSITTADAHTSAASSRLNWRPRRFKWTRPFIISKEVDCSWNVMTHGDAREGKWRGNWRMQWIASSLHTTSEHGVSSISTADAHTSVASSRTDDPGYLNGLVRFAERRNLVSARVPSHFKRSLPQDRQCTYL